jgi:hypothetical protein
LIAFIALFSAAGLAEAGSRCANGNLPPLLIAACDGASTCPAVGAHVFSPKDEGPPEPERCQIEFDLKSLRLQAGQSIMSPKTASCFGI